MNRWVSEYEAPCWAAPLWTPSSRSLVSPRLRRPLMLNIASRPLINSSSVLSAAPPALILPSAPRIGSSSEGPDATRPEPQQLLQTSEEPPAERRAPTTLRPGPRSISSTHWVLSVRSRRERSSPHRRFWNKHWLVSGRNSSFIYNHRKILTNERFTSKSFRKSVFT